MKVQGELRHLLVGPDPNSPISGIGIVRFDIYCAGNAESVVKRCQEVLRIVLEESDETSWPSDESWYKLLPQWFIERCSRETTKDEDEEYLNWWRELSPEEQERVSREEQWALSEWVAWLQPDERQWFWWEALIENPDKFRLAVEVESWPFAWGALDWLLRASGAIRVDPEE